MKRSLHSARNLLLLYLVLAGLYFARNFLIPVMLGCIIAMLLLPICTWFERKHIGRTFSALLPVILFVATIAMVVVLLSWQASGLTEDANLILTQVNELPGIIQGYVDQTFGIPPGTQQQIFSEKISEMISAFIGSIPSFIGKSLLVIVYVFLFIYYRNHLREFTLKLVPDNEKEHTKFIINSGSLVAQKYISGIARMILLLWAMYSIGFSIAGVRHALFFAMLCGILEIVPYLGNITGCGLTAMMAFTQGGSSMALWILLIYGFVQFTQTYLLEPMIVGAKVSLNPLFTIVALTLGEILWGVPGMILAIPVLGIAKIVCDNIPSLQAYGFLIGEVRLKDSRDSTPFQEKK